MATVSPNWEAQVEQVMLEAYKGYQECDEVLLSKLIEGLSISQAYLLKAGCEMVFKSLDDILA